MPEELAPLSVKAIAENPRLRVDLEAIDPHSPEGLVALNHLATHVLKNCLNLTPIVVSLAMTIHRGKKYIAQLPSTVSHRRRVYHGRRT